MQPEPVTTRFEVNTKAIHNGDVISQVPRCGEMGKPVTLGIFWEVNVIPHWITTSYGPWYYYVMLIFRSIYSLVDSDTVGYHPFPHNITPLSYPSLLAIRLSQVFAPTGVCVCTRRARSSAYFNSENRRTFLFTRPSIFEPASVLTWRIPPSASRGRLLPEVQGIHKLKLGFCTYSIVWLHATSNQRLKRELLWSPILIYHSATTPH